MTSARPTPRERPGRSFIDNAVLKARAAASQCDLITIADDSGITIDALNGMPGILSARWAGVHGDDKANLELVLAQLADVPDDRLGAAFVCAAALVVPGTNRGKVAEERMLGHLVREPRGENGFGYDPIFVALGETLTNAELAPERKDEISHRAKALRALVPYIKTALADAPQVAQAAQGTGPGGGRGRTTSTGGRTSAADAPAPADAPAQSDAPTGGRAGPGGRARPDGRPDLGTGGRTGPTGWAQCARPGSGASRTACRAPARPSAGAAGQQDTERAECAGCAGCAAEPTVRLAAPAADATGPSRASGIVQGPPRPPGPPGPPRPS